MKFWFLKKVLLKHMHYAVLKKASEVYAYFSYSEIEKRVQV